MNVPVSSLQFAGFLSRLVAFVVDLVVILTALAVFRLTAQALYDFFTTIVPVLRFGFVDTLLLQLGGVTASAIAQGAYFILFWTLNGQTPGMALMGLQVIHNDAVRPPLPASIIRYFGYWLSAIALGLGFLWVLVDRRRRGWHDILAGTYVVHSAAALLYHEQVMAIKARERAITEQLLSETQR